MTRPFVSVLVDTYNHERFIEQALRSVLEQDFPAADREILVVDDGSSDRTPEIVRKFAPHVRLIRKTNGGQASAFNAGIPECRGEIIAFLDGDDWWAPGKLRTVCECLRANPGLGAVGHGLYEVFPDERAPRLVVPEKTVRLSLKDVPAARLFSHLRAFLGTSRLTLRRSLLERILPVPEELVIEADEFLFTLATALGTVLVLDTPLFYYRIHSENLYQFNSQDSAKLRRKEAVLSALLRVLPPKLAQAGCPETVVRAVLESIWVDAERMRLSLNGGVTWRTFQAERTAYRLSYRECSAGYRVFQAMALGISLLLPPRSFYRLRNWYTVKSLSRIRRLFGEATPAAPVLEKWMDT